MPGKTQVKNSKALQPLGNKPTKKKVVKSSKKESKTETFIRIAEPRVKAVLRSLRILGNCSNRNNYEYNTEQVDSMFESITQALLDTESKFTKSKSEQESFSF